MYFSDNLVVTLSDPSQSFTLYDLAFEVDGVNIATIVFIAADGTVLQNTTVSKPTINQSINDLHNQSIDQPTNQSINNQPINQSTNQ